MKLYKLKPRVFSM